MLRIGATIPGLVLLAGCAGFASAPPVQNGPVPSLMSRLPYAVERAALCPKYGKGSGMLTDGDFHQATDPGTSYRTYSKGQKLAPSWSVTANTVDFAGTGFWDFDHLCSVDLDGLSAVGGIKHRALTTKKGARYRLSFLMSGNSYCGSTIKKMKVAAGDRDVVFKWSTANGHSVQYGIVASKRLTFAAASASTTLTFTSLDAAGSGCGPVIGALAVAPE